MGELSLIAFPTRELFLEKIDDFDLIIFDRYKRRGILPSVYLENVRNYVEKGGAILVAAGPDFASADSIYRSPLATIMPANPTARVIENGFRPEVSDLGRRHPVTANLMPDDGQSDWGSWMRQIEVVPTKGQVVMTGAEGAPLLILDRVGRGRVALLTSDHAWLWSREFEGGGPQLELLRRLAHWMMKEPELEEEVLFGVPETGGIRILRRSLLKSAAPVTIISPTNQEFKIDLEETQPGQFEAFLDSTEIGLFHLIDGEQKAVVGVGAASPREFIETIATDGILAPLLEVGRGGASALSNNLPALRLVRSGRPASGRGWLGLTPRDSYRTNGVRQQALLPPWLVLMISTLLIISGWLREGRR